jgi:hypothetical protein
LVHGGGHPISENVDHRPADDPLIAQWIVDPGAP